MTELHLALEAEYFDEIAAGKKKFEYREIKPYWSKRLVGKQFDRIVLTKGYPKKGDVSRTLFRPWSGYQEQTILHKKFGPLPVKVFAIIVND